jgi:hypothetical protein
LTVPTPPLEFGSGAPLVPPKATSPLVPLVPLDPLEPLEPSPNVESSELPQATAPTVAITATTQQEMEVNDRRAMSSLRVSMSPGEDYRHDGPSRPVDSVDSSR